MDPHPRLQDRWRAARGTGPDHEAAVLLDAWDLLAHSDTTRRRVSDLAARFARRLTATGVASLLDATPADVDAFVWAPTRRNAAPAMSTVHLRRTAVRDLYRLVQAFELDVADPSVGLGLPAKDSARARPLTDGEMALVRTAALGRSRRPLRAAAVVALAEASATTGEIPKIAWADIDLDTARVHLPGADPIRPRTAELTTWGVGVLHRWRRTSDLAGAVVPRRPSGGGRYAPQAATASMLAKLLTTAGVAGPGVRPTSIRLWAANTRLAEAGVESAALLLGIDSLDAAAATLGYQWQEDDQ